MSSQFTVSEDADSESVDLENGDDFDGNEYMADENANDTTFQQGSDNVAEGSTSVITSAAVVLTTTAASITTTTTTTLACGTLSSHQRFDAGRKRLCKGSGSTFDRERNYRDVLSGAVGVLQSSKTRLEKKDQAGEAQRTTPEEDETAAFCNYLKAKMKGYSPELRKLVQHRMFNVVMEADLGILSSPRSPNASGFSSSATLQQSAPN